MGETNRRQVLLSGAGLLGAAAFASPACAATRAFLGPMRRRAARRTLVLLQLSGGNDGLSTVVPYGDDGYGRSRKSTRIGADEVLALDDYRGLHPKLGGLKSLFDDGRLAIVEGVGYPSPNRSHFKSLDIWHTASAAGRAGPRGKLGWIGRLGAAVWPETRDPNVVVHVGANPPYSLHSREHPPVTFLTPSGYRWAGSEDQVGAYEKAGETTGERTGSRLEFLRTMLTDAQRSSEQVRRATLNYRTAVEYPQEPFADALRHVAAMVEADLGVRVFSVELDGFDTHDDQRNRHDRNMQRLDAGLSAFLEDLRGRDRGDQVLLMAFSEFGRRVQENGSRGTDHGVAGPVFVAGNRVKGGLFGEHPSLEELDEGDLIHTTDFRSVYATVVQKWFGADPARVLGGEFPTLELI